MSVNKAIILGHLGRGPELTHTPSGAAVCNFSVATNESWNDKDGNKQVKTEWHNITVWGKLGEFCNQYLESGRQVFIEGSMQTNIWEDKNSIKRYETVINASSVQLIGPKTNHSSDQKINSSEVSHSQN